jgi:hypothetical protein
MPVWSAILAAGSYAHDIPNDITVHGLVKPSGSQLQVILRVPLKSMRDMEFPEQGGGYLDVPRLAPLLPDAATVWLAGFVDLYEGGAPLPKPRVSATQISLASDRSFVNFQGALARVMAAKPDNSERLVWNQVWLDVLLEYPIRSEASEFSIRPRLEHLANRVVTVLRFVPPGGAVRAFEFAGDPGLVELDPRWDQAVLRFVRLGFLHILDGTDHLLFLLCLVIPFRRFGPLLLVVTAFTVAHSFTLIAAAYQVGPDALWFPPLIETLIAASIVYMALENIVGASAASRRWIIAFAFGLVHGFGFSFALQETMQFAGSHLLASLVSFNIGVELGQLLVLLLAIPLLNALFRFVVAERMGTIIVSALVAHTSWHWMTERWERLRQYPFEWPEMSAASMATALRWTIVLLLLMAAIHLTMRMRASKLSK